MSQLFLVRHAQASFLADDYDVLSELGHEQSRLLGAYWARLGLGFDAVYSGPLRRQIHTAELARQAMQEASGEWPELVVLAELDEYAAEGLLKSELPRLVSERPELGVLLAEVSGALELSTRRRAFERVLQSVMRMWAAGELSAAGSETWQEFTERVATGLRKMTRAAGRGARVAAFSSGGAIGVAVASVLLAPHEQALELGWALQNASVSELMFSESRISLSRFNVLAHLEKPALWSYR